ncbi:hypothetical protein Pmani_024362 [Petrolisthes manimaculis]|uniref:DNA polymerase eta n=1 Tax=Petrolisthes manimaculis TaxID=1843537 RepID=A0AAE1P8Y7_9EUCA|nr:hypothetical protein Pmani_024362 [Petrolisthes manimaculis]
MTERVVVLVDMDCFYVQVEERDHPHIKGVPAAVVQYNAWKGGGIIAVNYEARAAGVKRSMRGDEARAKCPNIHLIVVPVSRGKADLTKYREAGKEVLQVLSEFTDRIERASIDEAYLDLSEVVREKLGRMGSGGGGEEEKVTLGSLPSTWVIDNADNKDQSDEKEARRNRGLHKWLAKIYEGLDEEESPTPEHPHWDALRLICAAKICEEMRAAVLQQTGFKCSAGIAHNKMLAKLTCGLHKPNQQTLLPQGAVQGLWEGMEVGRVRNLGGKLGDTLTEDLGCTTMAHLAAISLPQLRGRFDDKTAFWLHNLGKGIDHEQVTSRQLPKSIGCSKNFMGREALNTREKVEKWTCSLVEELCERLEVDQKANKRRAKTLTVGARLDGDERWTSFSRSCPLPCYVPERITRLILSLLHHTNQAPNREISWIPSIKLISLSASKFEDWEGASSGNIQSMFKKAAALNTSKLMAEKVDTSFSEDGTALSPQVSGTAAHYNSVVIDKTTTHKNNSMNAEATAHIDDSVIGGTVCSDSSSDINKSAADNGKGGIQTTSPGSSFFKNFILKRQKKLNNGDDEEVKSKDNSCSPVKPCTIGSTCSNDDDGDDNLDLLVNCLENDGDNSNDCEADLDTTFCEDLETLSSSIEVIVVEENPDKRQNRTSISLSPDLFSSNGSNECGDIIKQNEDFTKCSRKDALPNISLESHAEASEKYTTPNKADGSVGPSNLVSRKYTSSKPLISSSNPSLSPENTDQSLCQVSVEELFPNLDDFDSSLLPFLPDGLREKVVVKLAQRKTNLQTSSDGDIEILKFVQKSPSKNSRLLKSSMCNTPHKHTNLASAVGEGSKKNETKECQRQEECRDLELKRVCESITKDDGGSSSESQNHTNPGGESTSKCQSRSKNSAEKFNEYQNDVKSSGGVASNCQGVLNQDETDQNGAHEGRESDTVGCRECGKRISPFDLPEHLDFHVALKLQSDLRHEEGQGGLVGPGNPRPGSKTVPTKRNRSKKRGRPSKGDMESHKLQKIDTFFTR